MHSGNGHLIHPGTQVSVPTHASARGDPQTRALVGAMSNGHPELALAGRRRESQALDRLLESVRAGQSRVLVFRGAAGVGPAAVVE
jgi:hypothetical protein